MDTISPIAESTAIPAERSPDSEIDCILSRIRHGRHMLAAMKDFLKQRASIEADYAKQLTKLANQLQGMKTDGTFEQAWLTFGISVAETADNCKQKSDSFYQLYQQFEKFAADQMGTRKKTVNEMNEVRDLYYEAEIKLCKNRSAFDKAKQIKTMYEKELQTSRTKQVKLKDIEKAQKSLLKTSRRLENLAFSQRTLWSNCESAAMQWRGSVTAAKQMYMLLERQRLDQQRETCWLVSNIEATGAVTVDQLHVNVREALLRCAIEADVENGKHIELDVNAMRPATLQHGCLRLKQKKHHNAPLAGGFATPIGYRSQSRAPSVLADNKDTQQQATHTTTTTPSRPPRTNLPDVTLLNRRSTTPLGRRRELTPEPLGDRRPPSRSMTPDLELSPQSSSPQSNPQSVEETHDVSHEEVTEIVLSTPVSEDVASPHENLSKLGRPLSLPEQTTEFVV